MIAKTVRRFLQLLFTFRIYTKHFKITYDGDITSANKIWSAQHWSVRWKVEQGFNKVFAVLLLKEKVKKMNELSLFTFYNSKHDVDNIFCLNKVFMDTVKGKYLPEDDTRYYKSTHTIFDNSLPKGTVEFHLVGN